MNKDLLESRRTQLHKRYGYRQHIAKMMESNEKEIKKLVNLIADYKSSDTDFDDAA